MYNLKRIAACSLVIIAMMVTVFSPPQTACAASRGQEGTISYKTFKKVSRKIGVTMRVDKPCGLAKDEFIYMIKKFKNDYGGVLNRNAGFIWEMEQKYDINALFYCGIYGLESGYGKYGWPHNYTGMMGCKFKSDKEGIEATFKNLKKNYINKGRKTILKIGPKYCETRTWPWQIKSVMKFIIKPSCQKSKKH